MIQADNISSSTLKSFGIEVQNPILDIDSFSISDINHILSPETRTYPIPT